MELKDILCGKPHFDRLENFVSPLRWRPSWSAIVNEYLRCCGYFHTTTTSVPIPLNFTCLSLSFGNRQCNQVEIFVMRQSVYSVQIECIASFTLMDWISSSSIQLNSTFHFSTFSANNILSGACHNTIFNPNAASQLHNPAAQPFLNVKIVTL